QAGTPQGGSISPTLANMTLDGLEQLLAQHFPRERWREGKRWRPKVNLVRYEDDFIITGASRELLETEVRPLVERFLQERGLTLSPDKTRITHIGEGFDFLGQNLRKYGGASQAIEEEHARILGESSGTHRREQVCEPNGAGETVESGHS